MLLSNPFTHDARVYNEALALVKAGYEVTVIGWDRNSDNPLLETLDGIQIIRVRNTWFMDMLPYDIFRLKFWWKEAYKRSVELNEEHRIQAVHCHDLDTLPTGVRLKRKLGIPLVYDAHEIWGYMVARDLPMWWAKHYLRKEKRLVKNVDKIITVSDPLRDYFNDICNVPVTIVMNCKPLQGREYNPPTNKIFTILYVGQLNKQHFILELAEAVDGLKGVKGIIGGMGKPEYLEAVKERCKRAKNVDFIGKVPMKKVIPMTKAAHVVFHMVDPKDLNNRIGTGNKLFESMVCGRPIICTKGANDGTMIEGIGCGLAIKRDVQTLRDTIRRLKEDPELCEKLGRTGIEAAYREYSWERQAGRLRELYDGLINASDHKN